MQHALPLLIETAEAARDQQAAGLARAREAVHQAATTLERLRQFRAECLARSAAGSRAGTDGVTLQSYQGFVTRLDEAIGLQQGEAQRRASRAAEQQERLLQSQQRLLALQALQQREAQRCAALAQRQAQREADEFAAQVYTRRALESRF